MREGEDAHGALLRGHVDGQSASPLRLTARHMNTVRQVNQVDRAHVGVIGRLTFDGFVNFWNVRARSLTRAHGAPVISLPRESLRHPEQLGALTRWLFRQPSMRRTPDMLVACPSDFWDEAQAALAALPFEEDTGECIGEKVGVSFAPNDPPTFRFAWPMVGGDVIRGTTGNAPVHRCRREADTRSQDASCQPGLRR